MHEWWIFKYQKGFSSKPLGGAITNSILHDKLGLLNIEAYYEVKYKERMEWDRTYSSQLEFIFI